MNKKILTIVAIFSMFIVLNILYAMTKASVNLIINENKNLANSASWDIHFENLSNVVLAGDALETKKPYITSDSTTIRDFDVTFQKDGDTVTYLFDVVNNGSLNAKVSSIHIVNPICTGKGEYALQDAKMVCDNIKYDLLYENGNNIYKGDTLQKKERKRLKLRLYFSGKDLPYNEVSLGDMKVAIVYSQK